MSDVFERELHETGQRIEAQLGEAMLLVERVGDVVLRCDPAEVKRIADAGARLKRACRRIEIELISLSAREAPVAGALRRLVAMSQTAQHAALIANQFGLIAEQLLEVDPEDYERRGTASDVSDMAFLAAGQLVAATSAFTRRDPSLAAQIEAEDDRIDELNRAVFAAAYELEASPERREVALRHVLIARSLERIGDNCVKIAELAAVLGGGGRERSGAPAPAS